MTARLKSLGIDRLSRDERLDLVQEIYQSLEEDHPGEMLTEEQKQELDRRLASFAANPDSAIPWHVVESEALARIRK